MCINTPKGINMSIYEQFLKKGHKIRPVRDFREIVYFGARDFGKLPAFILRDRTVSYLDLEREYKALTTAMIDLGYSEKRIAVIGANSYGWILSYLAAASIGVVVPIDKELSAEDMLEFIREAGCVAVCADSGILDSLGEIDGTENIPLAQAINTPLSAVLSKKVPLSMTGVTPRLTLCLSIQSDSVFLFSPRALPATPRAFALHSDAFAPTSTRLPVW